MSARQFDSQLRSLLLRSRAVRGDDVVIDGLKLPGGNVRADMVVVNDAVSGFLIWGAHADSAATAEQVLAYDRFFRYSNILTVPDHLDGVGDLVPDSWGIWVALGSGQTSRLRCVRPAFVRYGREQIHVAGLLTRQECWTQLGVRGLARGGSRLSKDELAMRLGQALPIPVMDAYLAACLKKRFDQAIPWWASADRPEESERVFPQTPPLSHAVISDVSPAAARSATFNLIHLARARLQSHRTADQMGTGAVPGTSSL